MEAQVNNDKTGGPAFPATLRGVHNAEPDSWHMVPGSNTLQERTVTGMTLRDYFAAKAMQGIIATFDDDITAMPEQVACLCYKIADAMLAARKEDK